jgi:hypothetical protein
MDDLYLSIRLDERRTICVSPISAKTYREAGGVGLGGDFGYFVYEMNEEQPESGVEVIAKAASAEAATRLFEMISMAKSKA